MQKPYTDYSIRDPPLSENGLTTQCAQLSQHLQDHVPLAQQIELIVSSPMQRTLQTTKQVLGWLVSRGIKPIALAEVQETTTNPCDVGSSIPELEREWPQFDWSLVDSVFPAKEGLYEFSGEALLKRGAVARARLRNRPEKVIAVVSHAGFLRIGLSHKEFGNADYRIFDFEDGEYDPSKGPKLIEWESTEESGGGMGRSPKGLFGWRLDDFMHMPQNKGKSEEELEEMVAKTPWM